MTGLSEPCRARDAGLCQAVVAMVTDCDCWHPGYGAVDLAQVIAVMAKNTSAAHGMVKHLAPRLAPNLAPCPHLCDRALRHAPINAPDRRGPTLPARLDAVAARVP